MGFSDEEGKHADLEAIRTELRLDPDTPERIQKVRNKEAASASRQVGLEVIRRVGTDKLIVDGAFFKVMILGAAVEAWRFAVRHDGVSPNMPDTQSGPTLPDSTQIHPSTDLPRAMLFIPPFWPAVSFAEPPTRQQRILQAQWRKIAFQLQKLGLPALPAVSVKPRRQIVH